MTRETTPSLQQASSLLGNGKLAAARIMLAKLVHSEPDNAEAWFLLSRTLDDIEHIRYALRQVLRIEPGDHRALGLLEKMDSPKELVEIRPSKPPIADWDQIEAWIRKGKLNKARRQLRRVLIKHPDSAQAWYLLSCSMGTSDGELYALQQAIRLDPSHSNARARLAKIAPRRASSELGEIAARKKIPSTFSRVSKYTLMKAVTLFLTVVMSVVVTILIANFGGHVDEIKRGQIDLALMGMIQGGAFDDVPEDEREQAYEQFIAAQVERKGLNEPFLLRTVLWLADGLTLNWGTASLSWRDPQIKVSQLILDVLPRTLLLFGTANLLLFLVSIWLATKLSQTRGAWLDKLFALLSPFSSIPPWVYGIVLTVLTVRFNIKLFERGTFEAWPEEFSIEFIPILFKIILLPVVAIFLSKFTLSVYAWRTFFFLYHDEDFVEMGRAKGLPPKLLENRYIIRPTLPTILTSFALILVTLWGEVIILEYFFNVEGIGTLFVRAVTTFRIPLVVACVTIFSYLLAISVFVIDLSYAIVDPRVQIGVVGRSETGISLKERLRRWNPFRRKRKAQQRLSLQPLSTPSESLAKGTPRKQLRGKVRSNRPMLLFKMIFRNPLALSGLVIIFTLIGISAYTIIAVPIDNVIDRWRLGDESWRDNPKNAPPVWVNFFRRDDLPEGFILSSITHDVGKTVVPVSETMTEVSFTFEFDYPYADFPQDLSIRLTAEYEEKFPFVEITWIPPDEREVRIASLSARKSQNIFLSQENKLQRKVFGLPPITGLFVDTSAERVKPLQGTYKVLFKGFVFEEQSDFDAELIMFGQVHGLAGTDNHRRDLSAAILWGTPIALSFGLLAAVGTSVTTMVIAAIGAWFGGVADSLVQRITEINMVLPFLPVSLMIFIMYSKSFWVILGVIVLLSIFGSSVKSYRSVFVQLKNEPYIEAATAYGVGNWRMIFRYLIPRIISLLIPQLIILVPSYVYLEAALAFLGLSDPVLPTWGKLLAESIFTTGIWGGKYHLVLLPAGLLMMTGYAFAALGFSLERFIDPKLRRA